MIQDRDGDPHILLGVAQLARFAGVRPARPRSKPGFDVGVSPGNNSSL